MDIKPFVDREVDLKEVGVIVQGLHDPPMQRTPSKTTVYVWYRRGVINDSHTAKVKLRTRRFGGIVKTTLAWVKKFVDEVHS